MYAGPRQKTQSDLNSNTDDAADAAKAELDANEADMYDHMPLNDSDIDFDEFHDVGTWSDDDSEGLQTGLI